VRTIFALFRATFAPRIDFQKLSRIVEAPALPFR
jgi:hypothetical protein